MQVELNDDGIQTGSCVAAMMRAFRFGEVDIRTFEFENGGPWFGAEDVCNVLGEGSLGAALDRVDESGKRVAVVPANPKYEAVAVVNEAGLRSMVDGHPQADTFLEWVARDVVSLFHARKLASAQRYLVPTLPDEAGDPGMAA